MTAKKSTLLKLALISLFIISINQRSLAQADLRYSLGDLQKNLTATSDPKTQAEVLIKLSNFYMFNKLNAQKNLDSSVYYAKAAVGLTRNGKAPALAENAVVTLANAYLHQKQPEKVLLLINKSTGNLKARLLMETGKYYLYKSGEYIADLNNADHYLYQALDLSNGANTLPLSHEIQLYLSDVLCERGDIVKSRDQFIQLGQSAEKMGDLIGAASSYSRLGDHYKFSEEVDKVKYYQLARSLFIKAGSGEQQINMLKALADVHFHAGKLPLAEKELLTVAKWYKDHHYKNLQDTYCLLAIVYRYKGDLDQALNYALQAVEYAGNTGTDVSESYYFNALAQIYSDLGNATESVFWYKKVIQLLHKQNSDLMYNNLKDLSTYLIQQGHADEVIQLLNSIPPSDHSSELEKELIAGIKGKCYLYKKDYAQAERYFLEMMHWESLARLHTYNSADSYSTIADFYMARKNYVKAEAYLKQILKLTPNTYPLSRTMNVYLQLSMIDSAQNNQASALSNFKIYKQLNDSIFNISKSHQIQELLVKYNSKQKDDENQLLKKESQLQRNQLQRADLLTRITITGIIALLIILILLYAYLKNRLKAEALQARYQEEISLKNSSLEQLNLKQAKLLKEKEWLIKEIHHRVKNNLQVVMSLLNTQVNYLNNPVAIDALRDSQTRLHSIALIHQKLFQTEHVSQIEIGPYIIDLMKYLCDTFHYNQLIRFEYYIGNIGLDISQAIPLGLIVNEAVTNIIKYAFPNNQQGLVTITLHEANDSNYEFRITDNGQGLPEGFIPGEINTLGMILMQGLSHQLGGELLIRSNNGVMVSIIFPKEYDDQLDEDKLG